MTEEICCQQVLVSGLLLQCFCICDESLRGELRDLLAGFVVLHLKALTERKEAAQLQDSAFIRGGSECFCSSRDAGAHFLQVTLQCSVKWLSEVSYTA